MAHKYMTKTEQDDMETVQNSKNITSTSSLKVIPPVELRCFPSLDQQLIFIHGHYATLGPASSSCYSTMFLEDPL